MNQFDIYAKSSLDPAQIKTKVDLGASDIEIQLFSKDISKITDPDTILKEISSLNAKVQVVHMPLPDSRFELQELFLNENVHVLETVTNFANRFGQEYNKKILIVIHLGWRMKDFYSHKNIFRQIIDFLKSAQEKYRYIEYCFENVIPLVCSSDGLLSDIWLGGFAYDNCDFVSYLHQNHGIENTGTVLDTCHALVSIRFFRIMEKYGLSHRDLNLEEYFSRNEPVIKLIHLASVKDLGFKPYTHGTPFTKNDLHLLQRIMALYDKHNYKCPITLEVFETDYLNCVNFAETRANLLNLVNTKYSLKIA